jgi:hypothetical protein
LSLVGATTAEVGVLPFMQHGKHSLAAFDCIWWPVLFDKSTVEAYPEDNAGQLIVLRLNA